jgi:hypothetical protein
MLKKDYLFPSFFTRTRAGARAGARTGAGEGEGERKGGRKDGGRRIRTAKVCSR